MEALASREQSRSEGSPLVGAIEACEALEAVQPRRPVCRSRAVKVVATAVLGFCCLIALVGLSGQHSRTVRGDKVNAAAVTGLVLEGNRVVLEVGTSTQAYSESDSPVVVSFLVGGTWTEEQELFQSSQEGETHMMSYLVSGWPTAVRLRITGNDGWGYSFIRMSFGGVEQSLLESDNGQPYGRNEFWLDGNDGLDIVQVFPVPSSGSMSGSRSSSMRLLAAFLLVAAAILVIAYLLREHIRKYLAVFNRAGGPPPAMQSQQGLLLTGPMASGFATQTLAP